MAEPANSCNQAARRALTRCFASHFITVKKALILHVMLLKSPKIEAAPMRHQEFAVPRGLFWTMGLIVSLALAIATQVLAFAPAFAATQDGNWTVLVITDQGTCDRGYRYSVNVSNGRVVYTGQTSIDMSGTVAPNGAVRVNIRFGGQGASGTGRLSTNSGAGIWHGAGSAGTCSGRWEAERR
jgi:hypothetical protein